MPSIVKLKNKLKIEHTQGKRRAYVHFDLNIAGLECNTNHEESGMRHRKKLWGKGHNTNHRATHCLHVSNHPPAFSNCFLLVLPGSLLCLSPEKVQSLPLIPSKNRPGLWNNPQAAVQDSPEKQALQSQGLNTHRPGKAEDSTQQNTEPTEDKQRAA